MYPYFLKAGIRHLFFALFFLIAITTYGQQVKVKCFGINQTIPVFKADANFSVAMDNQNSVIKHGILKPINQSDAIVEIRVSTYPAVLMGSCIYTIKFYKDKMQICKYETGATSIDNLNPDDYKGFKNIGPDDPHDKLTNFLKTTDLTADYKKYDWNIFFRKLIDNHLFDISSGQEFIDAVRAKTDEYNYPTGEWATIIQLKAGKRYRNLRYDGSYFTTRYQDVDLIKYETNFMSLLTGFFAKGDTQ